MTDDAKKGMIKAYLNRKDVLCVDEMPVSPEQAPADYDIFLCTRELPDALTAETAALRQLCSALIGSGYRVFFPSALPADLTDEQRAQRIVEALSGSKVMVAAGVGSENASDPVSEKLRSAFLKRAAADPSLGFIACWRDAADENLPADLAGREILDMSDLSFLVTLGEKLSEWLEPPAEEASEPDSDAREEEREPECSEDVSEEPETAPALEGKKSFPWIWLLIGVAAAAAVFFFLIRR